MNVCNEWRKIEKINLQALWFPLASNINILTTFTLKLGSSHGQAVEIGAMALRNPCSSQYSAPSRPQAPPHFHSPPYKI